MKDYLKKKHKQNIIHTNVIKKKLENIMQMFSVKLLQQQARYKYIGIFKRSSCSSC